MSQRADEVIATSSLSQNDVTAFWRNNDVIIASRARWGYEDN